MRALLIDPDRSVAVDLGRALKEAGYCFDQALTGEEGMAFCRLYDYDVVVLDIMLEDMQGLEVLTQIRNSGSRVPLVVASQRADIPTKIETLMIGADDYLVKPIHTGEMVARLQAIVRRGRGHASSEIRVGRLVIDLRRHLALIDGKVLHLTNKEYSILELLALRKGGMISKEVFLNHLYGGMDEPEIKILDVFICRLRKKIAEAAGGANFIQTIWGRGYILEDPATTRSRELDDLCKAG